MAWVGGFVTFVLPAAIFFLVGKLPVSTFWEWPGGDRTFELASSPSPPTKNLAAQRSEPEPRLVAYGSRGTRGEPAPLGLMLQGRADRGVVMIAGLVPGMTLSSGRAIGANAWEVPASDLANTWIGPPLNFVGAVNLIAELRLDDATIAHRQPVRIEWTAATAASPEQVTTASSPASSGHEPIAASPAGPEQVSVVAPPPAAAPAPSLDQNDIAMKDGESPSTRNDRHSAGSRRDARSQGAVPTRGKETAKASARRRAQDGRRQLVQPTRTQDGRANDPEFIDAIMLPRLWSDPIEAAPVLPYDLPFIRRR